MKSRICGAVAAALVLGTVAGACGGAEPDGTADARTTRVQRGPQPVAQVDDLRGRCTAVALDARFVRTLARLGIRLRPVGAARVAAGGVATFPITGGNVTAYEPGTVSPFVRGRIEHRGAGLRLEAEGQEVALTDFVIDPGRSLLSGRLSIDGRVAASEAPLFFLDGRTLEPLRARDDGTAVLAGTTVRLRSDAAVLLNETLGVTGLKGDAVVGVARITIATR